MKTLFTNLALLAVLSGLYLSCASDSYDPTASPETPASEASKHTVPIDDAIANLYGFLSVIHTESTKSTARPRVISSVSPIRLGEIKTKSVIEDSDIDNLVYLINFEDGNGYAMVAADDRLEEDVVMFIEDGSLSEEDLVAAFVDGEANLVFPDYPTTGPGVIIEENGEQYINPNTFEPYDDDTGDTYIGDLTMEDVTAHSQAEAVELTLAVRSLEYAYNEISRGKPDERMTDIDEFISDVVVETEYGNYVKSNEVRPILESLDFWHQGYPFNRYSPMVKKWLLSNERKLADAGCVPLAVAKIVAHFRFPQNLSINGVRIDWDSMSVNDGQCESAARLIRWIGNSSRSLYTWGYTGTLPSLSAKFLANSLFYQNVKYDKYDTDKVTKMLDKGYPLFVSSLPRKGFLNYDFSNAHGWNIDGYYLLERDRITKYYQNGNLINTVTTTTSTVYVYCDFGWGRRNNGHFVSGVFDLGKVNYNWYLKIITYDPPIQK